MTKQQIAKLIKDELRNQGQVNDAVVTVEFMNLTYEVTKLAEVYIRETIPQYQGYVKSFPKIVVTTPRESPQDRFTMKIYMEVDSVFGYFARTTYI